MHIQAGAQKLTNKQTKMRAHTHTHTHKHSLRVEGKLRCRARRRLLLGFENPLARQHFNCSGARTSELWLTLRIYLFSYLLRPLAHRNTHSQTHNGAINELEWQQEAGGRRQAAESGGWQGSQGFAAFAATRAKQSVDVYVMCCPPTSNSGSGSSGHKKRGAEGGRVTCPSRVLTYGPHTHTYTQASSC